VCQPEFGDFSVNKRLIHALAEFKLEIIKHHKKNNQSYCNYQVFHGCGTSGPGAVSSCSGLRMTVLLDV